MTHPKEAKHHRDNENPKPYGHISDGQITAKYGNSAGSFSGENINTKIRTYWKIYPGDKELFGMLCQAKAYNTVKDELEDFKNATNHTLRNLVKECQKAEAERDALYKLIMSAGLDDETDLLVLMDELLLPDELIKKLRTQAQTIKDQGNG